MTDSHMLVRQRRLRALVAITALTVFTALLVGCTAGTANHAEAGGSAAKQPGIAPTDQQRGSRHGSTAPTPAGRQLLTHTASLTVRVTDLSTRLTRAEHIVTKAGGYVASQQQGNGSTAHPTAVTTFHVPAKKYKSVLAKFGRLGTRTKLTQHTKNVTEQVADVGSRVASAKAALHRLRTLLKRARDVKDVLAIESAIDKRESDLEAQQARQRALATQVRYATVTLHLSGPGPAPAKRSTGFLAGLQAGWNAFLVFVHGALTVLGAVLPFAALAALGVVVWRVLARRRRRRADSRAT